MPLPDIETAGPSEHDMTPAMDAQPGVTELAELTPAVWIGEWHLVRSTAENNTTRAGWALAALLGARRAEVAGLDELAVAEAARTAYTRAVCGTSTESTNAVVVRCLLTGMRHLADAKGIDFHTPPEIGSPNELCVLMHAVVGALKREAEHDSAFGQDWHEVDAAAHDQYIKDVTGAHRDRRVGCGVSAGHTPTGQ